jgi:hypothetical protein
MADYVESLSNEQVDNALRVIENLQLAGKDLTPEKIKYAVEIANKAANMGISPELAVSIAYHESGLDPSKTGGVGEIGIMQVRPETAKGMGFDTKSLKGNPDEQIDAGLRYLKEQLNTYENDPKLAVVAYNAGPDASFFRGGDLHPTTKKYLDSVEAMGAFGEPAQAPAEQAPSEAPPVQAAPDYTLQTPPPPPPLPPGPTPKDLQEQKEGALIGAGIGATKTVGQAGLSGARGALGMVGENLARGAQEAGLASVAPPAQPPGVLGQMPPGPDVSGGKPTGGTGAANWGKAFGLGDIEANRATAMGNAPGSADELIKARAAALQRLQGMAPATDMAEDPTRGGLMVPKQTAYTGPRGPQGEIGGAKPPPVIPRTAPPASSLSEVTGLLRKLAETPLLKYAMPAVGGALSGLEAVRAAQELRKPNPDYGEAALSGAGALGGVMSMFPATAPVGIPLSLGVGAARFARDRARENEQLGYKPDVIPSNPMGDFGF